MKIFILLILGLFLGSCGAGGGISGSSDMRADVNMATLTVDSEEEFRNLSIFQEYKSSNVYIHEFTVGVPIKLLKQRFLHCVNNEHKIISSTDLIGKILDIANYKNTYVVTHYNIYTGYTIEEIWELDELNANTTKVKLYYGGFMINADEDRGKRFENYFAWGISEESSLFYRACKF